MKPLPPTTPLAALTVVISAPALGETMRYETLEVSSGDRISYAVHLPDGFDESKTYPVLIGTGDAEEGKDAGYYWKIDAYSHG